MKTSGNHFIFRNYPRNVHGSGMYSCFLMEISELESETRKMPTTLGAALPVSCRAAHEGRFRIRLSHEVGMVKSFISIHGTFTRMIFHP